MDLPFTTMTQLLLFVFVGFRMLGFLINVHFVQQVNLPMILKASLPFGLSLILFPSYSKLTLTAQDNFIWLTFALIQEFMIGALLSYCVNMLTTGAQIAGHQISHQVGFEIVEIFDPSTKTSTPLVGRLLYLVAIALFFSLGMHHFVLEIAAKTIDWIPPGKMVLTNLEFWGVMSNRFVSMADKLVEQSLFLVLPVVGALLALEVVLALDSKIAPQMNVFMVSMSLKLGLGLLFTWLATPYFEFAFTALFTEFSKTLASVFQI